LKYLFVINERIRENSGKAWDWGRDPEFRFGFMARAGEKKARRAMGLARRG